MNRRPTREEQRERIQNARLDLAHLLERSEDLRVLLSIAFYAADTVAGLLDGRQKANAEKIRDEVERLHALAVKLQRDCPRKACKEFAVAKLGVLPRRPKSKGGTR